MSVMMSKQQKDDLRRRQAQGRREAESRSTRRSRAQTATPKESVAQQPALPAPPALLASPAPNVPTDPKRDAQWQGCCKAFLEPARHKTQCPCSGASRRMLLRAGGRPAPARPPRSRWWLAWPPAGRWAAGTGFRAEPTPTWPTQRRGRRSGWPTSAASRTGSTTPAACGRK